ncbi:MAG: CHAP domain-containing protein [Candidatus Nomurabacteria bacterium]|nr:MAG: CHAP domain-containing protein [Candidatus Nomurabacteria bacterium]
MTIKPYIAAVAAVSSLALFFGQTAHAQAPNFIGSPSNFNPGNQLPAPGSRVQPRGGFPPQQVQYRVRVNERIQYSERHSWTYSERRTDDTQRQHRAARPAAPRSSNLYINGQCTWYAKKRRPDLPNGLGNANTWYARAAAKGYKVGSSPRVGAIGATSQGALGHVVYVESVHRNGTITVSEMNYNGGVGKVHTRTVAATQFKYIYRSVA